MQGEWKGSLGGKPGKITLVFQKKRFGHNIVGNETSLGRVYDLCILIYTEFEMIVDFQEGYALWYRKSHPGKANSLS